MTRPSLLCATHACQLDGITSRGYDVDVRADGTLRLTYRTKWQGEIDGTVYIADADEDIMRAARGANDHDDPDLDAAIRNWLDLQAPSQWKRVRLGTVNNARTGLVVRYDEG
jgi:hypothetical protein